MVEHSTTHSNWSVKAIAEIDSHLLAKCIQSPCRPDSYLHQCLYPTYKYTAALPITTVWWATLTRAWHFCLPGEPASLEYEAQIRPRHPVPEQGIRLMMCRDSKVKKIQF